MKKYHLYIEVYMFLKPVRVLFIAITCTCLFSNKTIAQPYLDIVNLKYSNSPKIGMINQNKNDIIIQNFSFGTNLPVQFKNKKMPSSFSPFLKPGHQRSITIRGKIIIVLRCLFRFQKQSRIPNGVFTYRHCKNE
ncbi:MAG: hypothetical protein IPL54_11605 [Chitinophagaceae bacterium]|nr:hypothetical protein [Chitinophagaceae bacterium]